jgi:hypothetical protein
LEQCKNRDEKGETLTTARKRTMACGVDEKLTLELLQMNAGEPRRRRVAGIGGGGPNPRWVTATRA